MNVSQWWRIWLRVIYSPERFCSHDSRTKSVTCKTIGMQLITPIPKHIPTNILCLTFFILTFPLRRMIHNIGFFLNEFYSLYIFLFLSVFLKKITRAESKSHIQVILHLTYEMWTLLVEGSFNQLLDILIFSYLPHNGAPWTFSILEWSYMNPQFAAVYLRYISLCPR